MDEHNYTSNLDNFLPWHIWVEYNCTQDEVENFNGEDGPFKIELYERWLQDQQILSYTRIVDGKIVQFQEFNWD